MKKAMIAAMMVLVNVAWITKDNNNEPKKWTISRPSLEVSDLDEDKQAAAAWKKASVFQAVAEVVKDELTVVSLWSEEEKKIGTVTVNEKGITTKGLNPDVFIPPMPSIEDFKKGAQFCITNLSSKRKTCTSFDFATMKWKQEGSKDKSLASKDSTVIVATSIAVQFVERPKMIKKKQFFEKSKFFVGDNNKRVCANGDDVRGTAVGVSKSLCCRYANQDANNQCSNALCLGCAKLLPCDSGCGFFGTDYFCFCGTTGVKCSYCP